MDREHPGPPPVGKAKASDTENSSSNPQPKIFDQKEPGGEGNEDVQRHNKEMGQRYGKKAPKDSDDKVGKQYWKGMWSSAGF